MFFIDPFLAMANKDGHKAYIRMVQRDIVKIVDTVAPNDRTGAANVAVVRMVSGLVNLYPTILSNQNFDVITTFVFHQTHTQFFYYVWSHSNAEFRFLNA
jgi:hypothetical protein